MRYILTQIPACFRECVSCVKWKSCQEKVTLICYIFLLPFKPFLVQFPYKVRVFKVASNSSLYRVLSCSWTCHSMRSSREQLIINNHLTNATQCLRWGDVLCCVWSSFSRCYLVSVQLKSIPSFFCVFSFLQSYFVRFERLIFCLHFSGSVYWCFPFSD